MLICDSLLAVCHQNVLSQQGNTYHTSSMTIINKRFLYQYFCQLQGVHKKYYALGYLTYTEFLRKDCLTEFSIIVTFFYQFLGVLTVNIRVVWVAEQFMILLVEYKSFFQWCADGFMERGIVEHNKMDLL